MPFYYLAPALESYRTLPLNAVYHAFPSELNSSAFCLHNHQVLEINVLLKGRMQITVEDRIYELNEGDAVLCNPFVLHSGKWLSSDPNGCFIGFTTPLTQIMNFRESSLTEACKDLENGKYCFDEFYPAEESRVADIIYRIFEVYTDKSNSNECLTLMLTYELFSLLFEKHFHTALAGQGICKDVEFAKSVTLFVQNNYKHDINTTDAAAALHMELSHFCHAFKKNFGVSFRNHLCRYRCVRAAELYFDKTNSITEIASEVGFSNYCYFSRSFKKYIGHSPSVFFGKRKNCEK